MLDETVPWDEDHDFCAEKVAKHLDRICGQKAETEIKIAPGRRADVYGFNPKTKTHYVCEVKVRREDAEKASLQLTSQAKYLAKKHKGDKVVPVLAIPVNLQDELKDYGKWAETKAHCKVYDIKIWIIRWRSITAAR